MFGSKNKHHLSTYSTVPNMSNRYDVLAQRFQWASIALATLEQNVGPSQLRSSLLCSTRGSDTDFSGGAGSWEHAVQMIESAAGSFNLAVDLNPRTICDAFCARFV